MCGIIGIASNKSVTSNIIQSLKKLEYRGYDSAGIATILNGNIDEKKCTGRVDNLEKILFKSPSRGLLGIGHVRWATHGVPSERNAHPHATDRVAVVHNGIIENFRELRQELESYGRIFGTDTDTEVIVQLIHHNLSQDLKPVDATSAALERLEGAFALAILFAEEQELMIGARRGSPPRPASPSGSSFPILILLIPTSPTSPPHIVLSKSSTNTFFVFPRMAEIILTILLA